MLHHYEGKILSACDCDYVIASHIVTNSIPERERGTLKRKIITVLTTNTISLNIENNHKEVY
jgi:hypothetical protein